MCLVDRVTSRCARPIAHGGEVFDNVISLITQRRLSVLCDRSRKLAALVVAPLLCIVVPLRGADDARPTGLIGYTEGRNDLPEGQFANWVTNRACVVRGDGKARRVLAEELTRKKHSWTQFAGWSPDDAQAIVQSLWESPENAVWEREHRRFRMTEGWLVDIYLCDMATGGCAEQTAAA